MQTIVTEGPAPGTRLQEGHYAISFTVVVMEGESRGATPIATCRVGYDVEGKVLSRLGVGKGEGRGAGTMAAPVLIIQVLWLTVTGKRVAAAPVPDKSCG